MAYEFKPDPKRKGRNKYIGSWSESKVQLIPLPFTIDSLRQVLDWGSQPLSSPYTHQEIAHWCDLMHMQFLDSYDKPDLKEAINVAADVDCQWELFLANSYSLEELQQLDFSSVRLPADWFIDWRSKI